ncbi:hypothetical protein DAEQUDRAFT_761808 [Daedalea quercina L-15889]|uniref:Uncharacterized protein n=1 Tax=Daedalea quercina L-15889 TaxID=1314783 RepID=A0A165TRV5_9APHY|nr:hypothetical protein DAEQUDRAFT_761808 [Daedalea quercina L-15889]
MGLFSRRAETLDSIFPDSPSAVSFRAIRARFYGNGKGKGKERDLDGESVTYSATTSPSVSSPYVHSDKQSFVSAWASEPRGFHKESRRVASSTSISLARHAETVSEQTGPRSSTDVVTLTLAQRLNELATANSEGLLSDDEYRLLRQSLFERFASKSQVPSETPLVPISGGSHDAGGSRMSSSSRDRRASSQFYVQSSRTSVQSKNSLTSSIGGFIRRATSRSRRVVSSPTDMGDTASIYTTGSNADRVRTAPRTLTSRASESSFRSESDRARAQQLRPILTQSDPGGSNLRPSRRRKRSGASVPPSAFHGVAPTYELSSPSITGEPLPNDEEVELAKDIRHHIELVEAEGRRLQDAFNGLELSTLTRRHKRPHIRPPIPPSPSADNSSVHTSEARSLHTTRDMDALSFKSGKSGGSGARTPSAKRRSPSGHRKVRASTSTSSATLISQPPKSVSRKGSLSSMSSRGRTGLSIYPGLSAYYGMASSSSVNLARSTGHLPLATVAESDGPVGAHRKSSTEQSRLTGAALTKDLPPLPGRGPKGPVHTEDEEIRTMEVELADIRRRRVEVTERYEARLEYLRARLKGAEIREKVMRK